MATRATSAAVWATTRGSAPMATITIWPAAVGPATPSATICATTRGAATVGPATTLLCPTTATTPMGNATAISTNGHAKGLVNDTPSVYLRGDFRLSSFLYRPHRDRGSSTTNVWLLWYLVARRSNHDRNGHFYRQQWPPISEKCMKSASLKRPGKVGLYILLPLAFVCIPTSWLEGHRSICLIRNVFGIKCPGCGMIRAISCVLHGNFKGAFHYNKLVVIVFPLLCYLWLQGVTTEYR